MPNTALDRLFNNKNTGQPVSVEEQLSAATGENDENWFMLDNMSQSAKNVLRGRIQPENLDPEPDYNNTTYDDIHSEERPDDKSEEILVDEQEADEITVSTTESKRGRKPKVTTMDNKKTENSVLSQYEGIIRILALGIVNDLKLHKYAYSNFTHQDTCLLLDYISQKINQ